MIQDLQNRNLELQQKLSVAVKVDDSKNNAISQFQATLHKLVSRVQVLQKEKREWENEKSRLKTRHSNEIKESIEVTILYYFFKLLIYTFLQKVQYYEKEVSKALNIAHGNHEKMAYLEKSCSDLNTENVSLKSSQKDLEDLLFLERTRNKEYSDNVKSKEAELDEVSTRFQEYIRRINVLIQCINLTANEETVSYSFINVIQHI